MRLRLRSSVCGVGPALSSTPRLASSGHPCSCPRASQCGLSKSTTESISFNIDSQEPCAYHVGGKLLFVEPDAIVVAAGSGCATEETEISLAPDS